MSEESEANRLVERSSFGTKAARSLSSRTPRRVADAIVGRLGDPDCDNVLAVRSTPDERAMVFVHPAASVPTAQLLIGLRGLHPSLRGAAVLHVGPRGEARDVALGLLHTPEVGAVWSRSALRVIASDVVYRAVIRYGCAGIDAAEFTPMQVGERTCWLRGARPADLGQGVRGDGRDRVRHLGQHGRVQLPLLPEQRHVNGAGI